MQYPINLPNSDRHPLVKVTATHPTLPTLSWTLDDSHKTATLSLPDGSLDDYEIVAQFAFGNEQVDKAASVMCLKARVLAPEPPKLPKPPKPPKQADPKPEPEKPSEPVSEETEA